jgi:CHAT domain-containing protein
VNELLQPVAVHRPQRDSIVARDRFAWLCAWLWFAVFSPAAFAGSWDAQLDQGVRARNSGNIYQSVAILTQALDSAPDRSARARAMTQLGLSLLQSGRLADAERTLQAAYDASTSPARISIALALGNVAAAEHDPQRAGAFYREVLTAPGDSPLIQDAKLAAQLNLARSQPLREKIETLEELYPRVEAIGDTAHRGRALFSLGQQLSEAIASASMAAPTAPAAAGSPSGLTVVPFLRPARLGQMRRLSYESLRKAADLAQQSGDAALRVEAFNALAQLYESQGRLAEALRINSDAATIADSLKLGQAEALLVQLDWRAARLDQRLGDDSLALAGYMHAARHLEAIRQDLPIEDAAGQSTYQSLLKPIYVNLLDLMLRNFDGLAPDQQPARLTSVLDAIELTHQAEMQDYLGDRCSVESVPGAAGATLQAGVAVIYTLVLNDRLEVIVRTGDGLLHHAAPVSAATLAAEIGTFRRQLLDAGSSAYLATARQLYGWLIEPFESQLAKSGVRELVIVPDSYLRLIPFAALHDGQEFIAQRYVISTVTGLTMTATSARSTQQVTLLAGLSEPGPVVDKLLSMGFTGEPAADRSIRAAVVPAAEPRSMPASVLAANESALRSELVLPAVDAEIRQLRPYGKSVSLLNGEFTVARFQSEVRTGRYSVIHVATHGFFGDSARESFLLAFDNIIHMDDLQNLISDNGAQNGTIELLTLSACDTATGDERAPLGFAGAAIRARARSVVGTLWAVSDDAAEQFMTTFYAALARQGKADALTQAQRALIRSPKFSHPYYWAPMVLIGDWN